MRAGQTTAAMVSLGFATTVAQVVLLREAMASLAGSELAWGAVLALWLAGMGLGSRLGVRFAHLGWSATTPVLPLVIATGGVVLFRAAPTLAGAVSGEIIPVWHSAWIWILAVLPAAVAGGLPFPGFSHRLGNAGRAYAFEASGSLVGGLVFSFVMAPLGSTTTLGLSIGMVVCAAVWSRSRVLGMLLLTATATLGHIADAPLAEASWGWSKRPGRLADWTDTRHQRLELSSNGAMNLYADGGLAATYPESYTTPLRSHLLMLLHSDPRRLLVSGALSDGSLVTILRHPVERVWVVEDDPALFPLLRRWYGPSLDRALDDERVVAVATDPLRALGTLTDVDLILLLGPDPSTLRRNRTRSREFFATCAGRLAPDGLLVVRTGISDTYLGGTAGRLLSVLASTLREVFPAVAAIPGENVLLVAARNTSLTNFDADELSRRWRDRRVSDSAFSPEILPVLLDPKRAKTVGEFVARADAPANTTSRPRAVLLAAALQEGRGLPIVVRASRFLEESPPTPLWGVLLVTLIAMVILGSRTRSVGPTTAALVGLSSMAWWLMLLGVWQATLGSVYAEIGALTGVFMGGLAGGAHLSGRWSHPARRLAPLLTAAAILSVAIAAGLPTRLPWVTVPMLLVAAGAVTGMAFAGTAALIAGTSTGRGAGIAFAADEVGAASAAVIIGLIALPRAGTGATAASLAVLQLVAAGVVWLNRE